MALALDAVSLIVRRECACLNSLTTLTRISKTEQIGVWVFGVLCGFGYLLDPRTLNLYADPEEKEEPNFSGVKKRKRDVVCVLIFAFGTVANIYLQDIIPLDHVH